MANIGNLFAQYGIRTVMTAPSNTAARQLMIKLDQSLNKLYKDEPKAREWFDVIYLPTTSATKADLVAESEEDVATEIVVEGEAASSDEIIDKYRLWKKIVSRIEKQSMDPNASPSEQAEAKKWLAWRNTLLAGGNVPEKSKKKFTKAIDDVATKIFSLKEKVRIVVTTCNNAALLSEYNYAPMAALVDEAAFASDHSQLRPVVRSFGHSEMAATFGLSAYAMFYGHPSVNTVRLKINYRMHEEIATLPGILTYTFIACAPNTYQESNTFQFYKEWYDSADGEMYRSARRDPAYGGEKDVNRIRRMFVNVQDGISASRQGSTSKRNFANINAICDYLISLIKHEPVKEGIQRIDPDNITILAPYKEEVTELAKQVKMRILPIWPTFVRWPRFRTIDGTQGSENEIVLLALTPADRHNGSKIGFLKEWNRVNVSLTRAKSVMTIFGNLDRWRSQLKVLGDGNESKNFAFMVVDLLDRGDIIDVTGLNKLPKTPVELKTNNWTMLIEDTPREKSKLNYKNKAIMQGYQTTPQKDAYERALLAKLQVKRNHGEALKRKLLAGEDFDLPFLQAGASMDMDDSQPRETEEDELGLSEMFEDMTGPSVDAMETDTNTNTKVDKGKGKAVEDEASVETPELQDDAREGVAEAAAIQESVEAAARQEELDLAQAIQNSKEQSSSQDVEMGESSSQGALSGSGFGPGGSSGAFGAFGAPVAGGSAAPVAGGNAAPVAGGSAGAVAGGSAGAGGSAAGAGAAGQGSGRGRGRGGGGGNRSGAGRGSNSRGSKGGGSRGGRGGAGAGARDLNGSWRRREE
ncbi:hypothetical protein ACMFMG_006243 [Clarireedia jacksonii]